MKYGWASHILNEFYVLRDSLNDGHKGLLPEGYLEILREERAAGKITNV